MNFWPAPGTGVTAEIHSPRQIVEFATLATAADLPPGFLDMLHFNLAVRLYPSYPRQGGIPPELAGNAADSKASVIAANIAAGILQGAQQPQAPPQQQAPREAQQPAQ
jgi:hypothetical protein